MARTKIDYGIDLGTTNSAICRMENGEPVIKKTDNQSDTMPSCVYINKKKVVQVGDIAFNTMKSDKLKSMKNFDAGAANTFIEFKRTMGTDKGYYCANMDVEFSSEQLSSEVLKALRSFISDESVKSMVVTVPAKFTSNQKDATLRAAELAGIAHCELLQEPIAASMAYGLSAKSKDGYWLVFDFGGGTFDAALIKVDEGIMKVIDTDGDNYLGGKNLDYAIVDEIILPYLRDNFSIESFLEDNEKKKIFQDAMKFYAEETKIQMSFKDTYNILSDLGDIPGEDEDGKEYELDITVTQEMMSNTLGPIFQKSIDISNSLLERNHLSSDTLDTLLLVGGPTYSPVLRKMLEEQIIKPDLSVDPMTVVARGAALFASTVDVSDEVRESARDESKIQLEFGYEATTVEEEELLTVRLLSDQTVGQIPEKIFVDVVRGDAAWSSGKTELPENGQVIEVKLNSGKANAFNVVAYNERGDLLESEPTSFTIIQGSKIGSATLPYNIGIGIKNRVSGKVEFRRVKGLEKNQSTPATGTANNLKTQNPIRPGVKEDFITISLYEAEHDAEGSAAILNEHIYDAIITGEHLPKLLPENSDVDLTVKVDREQISLSVFFPSLDFAHDVVAPRNTTQKEVDEGWLASEINKALESLNLLRQEDTGVSQDDIGQLDAEINALKKNFEQGRTDYDRKKEVLNDLRRSLQRLEKISSASEWPKIEEELKDVFYRLEETSKRFETQKSIALVEQYRAQIPVVIRDKNVKVAQDIIDTMRQINFSLADEGLGVQMEIMHLNGFNEDFDTLDWNDKDRARMTLDRGLQMAASNPVKEELRSVLQELYSLLPDADKAIVGGGDGSELVG